MPERATAEAALSFAGLGRLADAYDLVLCDVFGTLHDAAGVFPSALDALRRFRAGGGAVALVSNAAVPAARLEASLAAIGVGSDCYDAAVTAADVARALIHGRGVDRVLHIGAPGEAAMFDGLAVELCDAETAEIAVCTSYPDAEPALVLDRVRARGLDLICTNPDLVAASGGLVLRFAGLVAEAYAARGGRVIATGKPNSSIYALALARAAAVTGLTVPPERILAVGDTLALDVAGALAQGFSAIHVTPSVADGPPSPRLIHMPSLVW